MPPAKTSLRRALKTLAAILLPSAPAWANGPDCGAPGAPCAADGGVYYIARPAGDGPHPAVIYMHGYGGRAEVVISNRSLVDPILARGYAVIAPQGLPRWEGDKGGAWNSRLAPDNRDDVAFLGALADRAAAEFGLDRRRTLAAGFSGGGMMAWRLACDTPENFAGYAAISGLLWRPLPEMCAGPVRMLHVHGWRDKVVPIEGRSVAGGALTQGDLFAGLAMLRLANGCLRDDPDAYGMRDEMLLRTWNDCAAGSDLTLALHPGGHKTPPGWPDMAIDWFEGDGAEEEP